MMAWSAPPVWPTWSAAYHSTTAAKYGADQPLDVVADRVRQLGCVLDHEAGAAGERAPDAEGGRERVAALDGAIAGAQQSESRAARPGRQHHVARQRGAVPAEKRDRIALAHARDAGRGAAARTPFEVVARRRLERGELVGLVDDAQPIGGVDEQVAGVLDEPASPTRRRSSSTRKAGASIVDAVGERLPADDADPRAAVDALVGEDLARADATGRAAGRQAEVLVEHAAHRQRRGAGRPPALVADQDRRIATGRR